MWEECQENELGTQVGNPALVKLVCSLFHLTDSGILSKEAEGGKPSCLAVCHTSFCLASGAAPIGPWLRLLPPAGLVRVGSFHVLGPEARKIVSSAGARVTSELQITSTLFSPHTTRKPSLRDTSVSGLLPGLYSPATTLQVLNSNKSSSSLPRAVARQQPTQIHSRSMTQIKPNTPSHNPNPGNAHQPSRNQGKL